MTTVHGEPVTRTPESFRKKVPGKEFTGHHALTASRILAHIDFLEVEPIRALSGRIGEVIAPFTEKEVRLSCRRSLRLADAPPKSSLSASGPRSIRAVFFPASAASRPWSTWKWPTSLPRSAPSGLLGEIWSAASSGFCSPA